MPDAVRDSVLVASDPDTILGVIADFEAYPEWQDEIREVEVLDADAAGCGTRVRFVVDAKVFTTTMVLAYTYTADRMAWQLVEGDRIRRNDGSYVLADQGDGTTKVTYELEVEPAVPLPGTVRRRAARRIVHGALAGMKQRVEALG